MDKKKVKNIGFTELRLSLADSDLAILNRFRGELSPDDFIASILRMLESGVVMSTPGWVFEPGDKKI